MTLAIPKADSPLWREADLWRLWFWCLFHVSKRRNRVKIEGISLELAAGELAAPLSTIEKETGPTRDAVLRSLRIGKDIGVWTIRLIPWWVRTNVVN